MSEQESSLNVEAVEQTYWRNPILRYTQHPLHSPLLPLPYGDVSVHCECYELDQVRVLGPDIGNMSTQPAVVLM